MAKNVGAIEYDIKGNTTQIKKDLDETEKAASKTGQKIGAAFSKAASATVKAFASATAAVSAALVKFGKMGVEYNAEMESYTASFATMLGDEQKAIAKVNELKKFAASTPLAMTDLANATKTLLSFGIAEDKASEALKVLGDISQGDAGKLSSLTLAFSQMSSTGKLMGQDLLQMINAGFNPLNKLAQQTGLSIGQLKQIMGGVSGEEFAKIIKDANEYGKKVLENGNISAQVIFDAMKAETDAGGTFFGAMEKQSKTFNGQLSTLKDNAMSFLGELTQGLSDAAKNDYLPTINGWLLKLQEGFAKGKWEGLIDAASDVLGELLIKVVNLAPQLVTTAANIVKKLVGTIKANSRTILDAVMEIGETVLEGAIEILPDVLAFAGDAILALIEGLSAALPDLLPKIVEIAFAMIDQLIAMLPDFIDAAITLVLALAEGLIKAIPLLIEKIPVLVESLVTALIEALPQIIDGVLLLFDMLVESLPTLIIALVDAIPKITLALVSALTKDDNLQKFITGWIKLFMSLVTAIPRIIWELLQHLPEILDALWNGIVGFADEMQGAGWQLLEGLWNGIKDAFAWVWSKITGLFDGMVKGIKSFFGIASPSKLFRDLIGKNLDLGLAIGIEENADLPEDAALEMSTSVIHKMLLPDVSGLLGASPFAGLTNKNVVSVNNRLTGELVVDGYKLGEVVFKSFDDNYAYSGRA